MVQITRDIAAAITVAALFTGAQGCRRDIKAVSEIEVESPTLRKADSLCPEIHGGYGSDMAYDSLTQRFYLLTDRGPNLDGSTEGTKIFPLPGFNPGIGVFVFNDGKFTLDRKIGFRDSDGTPFCGLAPALNSTHINGETALDLEGNDISASEGTPCIDPEGLALSDDGTFWVSDEYGPDIYHFDSTGILISRLSPGHGLPASYAHRRANRGMEGLCISRDNRFLYGIMQSPLQDSTYIPLFRYAIADSTVTEFRYMPDSPENGVSAITYVNDSTILVLERDCRFPGNGKGFKKIFRVTLSGDPGQAVPKDLYLDILDCVPGYCHDKTEGMALSGDRLYIVNDDDFGLSSENGRPVPKKLPDGTVDRNIMISILL